jgi:hypothetical protein
MSEKAWDLLGMATLVIIVGFFATALFGAVFSDKPTTGYYMGQYYTNIPAVCADIQWAEDACIPIYDDRSIVALVDSLNGTVK